MTATANAPVPIERDSLTPTSRIAIALLIGAGLAALWLRPPLTTIADGPLVLAVLFGGLLAIGLVVPLPAHARIDPRRVATVTAIGVVAVCAAQLLVGRPR